MYAENDPCTSALLPGHAPAVVGVDPGGVSVKLSGVWFGGRPASQVTVSRLNHGPSVDALTAESVTVTG
jgi:hypothetical protein